MIEDILQPCTRFFDPGVQTVLRGQESRLRRIVITQGNLVYNVRSEES
jgi:TldD protein